MEKLNATMNAHLHINSDIFLEADVADIHSAAESMQHEAAKHRDFDARAKKAPTILSSSVPNPPTSTPTEGANMSQRPTGDTTTPPTQLTPALVKASVPAASTRSADAVANANIMAANKP